MRFDNQDQASIINWDSDLLKHYVRANGWRPACQARERRVTAQIKSRKSPRKKPLKYFTLCAANAVDVYMLEHAGLLKRASGRLEQVYFCERDSEEYRKIIERVGMNGFKGALEEIILFEEDKEITKFSLEDNPSREIRQKLEIKEQHQRLVKAFPFDIINLDIAGVFFPPSTGKISPMLKSIRRILEWQKTKDTDENFACDEFTLLLTSYIDEDDVNGDAVKDLLTRLNDNIQRYPAFKEAYESKWPDLEPAALALRNFQTFFSIALPKVLVREGLIRGWRPEYRGIYLYERVQPRRKRKYWMMSLVVHFSALRDANTNNTLNEMPFEKHTELYIAETTEVIQLAPVIVNDMLNNADEKERIGRDLAAIIDFRERALASN